VQCAESLHVQAYFDGEVDALNALDVERHTERCAECRALLEDLARTRERIRHEREQLQAPEALRGRIIQTLAQESTLADQARVAAPDATATAPPSSRTRPLWRTRPFWAGAGAALGAALAAALVFLFLSAVPSAALLDELAAAHVRSLMPGHLTDVVSTDQHTVKPWFVGRVDVSPVVADFTGQGYHLLGGRADYLDRQRAAVLVYQHGAHVINVFTWAPGGRRTLPGRTTRAGYHLVFWRVGDLEYCAVSDAGWGELAGLEGLLRGLASHDVRQ
jgi:anti-sigma factor RsiW